MLRKILLLLTAILLTVPAFCAKPRTRAVSPYQYGGRWYISAQIGPQFLPAENIDSYWKFGKGWKIFSPFAGMSLGCNINDVWDLRLAGNYGYHVGACNPYGEFFPYNFKVVSAFLDASVNCYAMGENYDPNTFKLYMGLGAGYTFGFSEVDHPYQVVQGPNLVPGFRFGGIWEFDTPGGFGWFIDLGLEFFGDWYNGLEPIKFPIDVNMKLSFGILYHFH